MNSYTFVIALAAALTLSSGCSKQEETPVVTPDSTASAVKEQANEAATAIQDEAVAAKKIGEDAVTDLKDQAAAAKETVQEAVADTNEQAASLTSKAQIALDNARKLLAENNWSEALKSLGELSGLKLTPEQQATFASLKEQAQKLGQQAASSTAADRAGQAVSDLLKK